MTTTDQVPGGDPDERTRRIERLTWGFVVLGVALRLARYAMNFPLWGDESFVAVNFIARGYRALLEPLDYGQICPLLFLWIERFVVVHLGYSEWTLRLFPLLCGVSSVVLFRDVAGLVLGVGGLPRLLAVSIFAVSFHPIRHAAEVKPYASDLLVALALLDLALRWRQRPERTGWLWGLVVVTPLALGLSHPAVFIAAGISLGLVRKVRSANVRAWLPFALYQVAMIGTFLGLYLVISRFQEQLALEGLRRYWAGAFPPSPWADPRGLARWLLDVHTGPMLAYPGGGSHGTSVLTLLAVLAGVFWLWRSEPGRRDVLIVLLAPFGLALVAAALRRYPYGTEARQMQFVVPSICLLAGAGAARLALVFPDGRPRRGFAAALVLVLIGFGAASIGRDLAQPYRFLYDLQARQFARHFWPEQSRGAELACVNADFDVARRRSTNYRTATYLCNQWIYSPQRREHGGPRWESISPSHPLRCVLYHETRPDSPEVQAWLDRMRQTYDLHRTDRVAINLAGSSLPPRMEQFVIYEFVPRDRERDRAARDDRESARR